ncbi:hypothetical protein MBN61_00875 [Candidatus Saccharibacteria bacterium]|nr:hypothetical protein [Candidatus Saccharibacteria bacterium]
MTRRFDGMDAVREVVDMSVKRYRRAIVASAVIALGNGFPRYEGDVDLSEIGQWIRSESIDHKLENVTFFLVHQTCQEKLGGSQVALRLETHLWGGEPYYKNPFFSFVEKIMGRLNQSCAHVQIGGDVYRIEL